MSYDPDFPATNAELVSAAFRTQFQGLKALIDALQSLTGAVVDGVNTLNPGEPASVAIQVVGSELRFTFGIPRGNDGGQGPPGSDGGPGPAGPQGPPFASAVVDGVSTLDPGNSATVESTFDGSNVHFTFGIPRGNDGAQGPEGPQGPPGDVSAAQLNDAIATTSANSNAVSTLDAPFTNEPPTLADLETLRGKVNELVLALRR